VPRASHSYGLITKKKTESKACTPSGKEGESWGLRSNQSSGASIGGRQVPGKETKKAATQKDKWKGQGLPQEDVNPFAENQ